MALATARNRGRALRQSAWHGPGQHRAQAAGVESGALWLRACAALRGARPALSNPAFLISSERAVTIRTRTERLVSGSTPKPGVLDIAPYKAARGAGRPIRYQLASNESAVGASPAAVEAFRSTASEVHLYPDGAAHDLRGAI